MSLKELLENWLVAKSVEDDAKKERVAIEEKILDSIGRPNSESQSTKEYDGFKVTVTPSVTRKLDIKGAEAILETIPEELRPVKKVVDETGIKWLYNNEPDLYKRLVPYIEVKEGKTGIKVVRA